MSEALPGRLLTYGMLSLLRSVELSRDATPLIRGTTCVVLCTPGVALDDETPLAWMDEAQSEVWRQCLPALRRARAEGRLVFTKEAPRAGAFGRIVRALGFTEQTTRSLVMAPGSARAASHPHVLREILSPYGVRVIWKGDVW